jgi:hypothetical protein
MNPLLTTTTPQGMDYRIPSAHLPLDDGFDPYQRARVCTAVLDLLAAVQSDALTEYLKPSPVTRLRAAQNAFREVGANCIAGALRAAQFSLTQVGSRLPMAEVVETLTLALKSATEAENVNQLIALYSHARARHR